MADHAVEPWRTPAAPQLVAACIGTSTFGMHAGAWGAVAPGLPSGAAALLAPPVTASSVPTGRAPALDERRRAELASYRLNMASVPPYGKHRRSARAT